MPDAKNQVQGRRNKSTGEAFETIIESACEVYKAKKLADVEKTPEPFKPVSGLHRKGKLVVFDCIAVKKAQPDFKGTLKGGQAVCFEAKTTESDHILQSVVTPKQAEELELHTLLGAKTYVFVCLKRSDFYRVPWHTWQNMKILFGHKFMTREDLEPFRIGFKNGYLQLFEF